MNTICGLISQVLNKPADFILSLGDEEQLAAYGLDSMEFIEIISLIEEHFKIEILDSDLLMENFESKKKIFEILDKYLEQI